MYITEAQLQRIVAKATKQAINEYMMGGEDYCNSYNEYRSNTPTNPIFDDLWIELHTLGQYSAEIYNLAMHDKQGKSTKDMSQEIADYLYRLLTPIYGFMSNRNPRKQNGYGIQIIN